MISSVSELAQCVTEIPWLSPTVLLAVLGIAYCPFQWNVIGFIEYNSRCLTKSLGKYQTVYILAFHIFTCSLLRDYFFEAAVTSVPSCDPFEGLVDTWVTNALFAVLFAVGMTFTLSSMYRLGISGTYLGDYCGILMQSRVTSFPFNVLSHPMYVGSSLNFLAFGILHRSLLGILLAAWVFGNYHFYGHFFEGPFTSYIYEQANKEKKKSN